MDGAILAFSVDGVQTVCDSKAHKKGHERWHNDKYLNYFILTIETEWNMFGKKIDLILIYILLTEGLFLCIKYSSITK